MGLYKNGKIKVGPDSIIINYPWKWYFYSKEASSSLFELSSSMNHSSWSGDKENNPAVEEKA